MARENRKTLAKNYKTEKHTEKKRERRRWGAATPKHFGVAKPRGAGLQHSVTNQFHCSRLGLLSESVCNGRFLNVQIVGVVSALKISSFDRRKGYVDAMRVQRGKTQRRCQNNKRLLLNRQRGMHLNGNN